MDLWSTIIEKWRTILTLVLGILLGVFALQNMARVELAFLVWSFESRRIVVIALSLAVGFIVGWIVGHARAGSADSDAHEP